MQLAKWFFACLLCLAAAAVQAVPVIVWTAEANQRGFANLGRQLQNTVLEAPTDQSQLQDKHLTPTQAYGGQAWEWSESRFKSAAQKPLTKIHEGQRWVARAQLVFPASNTTTQVLKLEEGPGLYLLWPMHRLDYVHISYRVNQGTWCTMSAGDRIPMSRWDYKNPFPAIPLPQIAGSTVDIVVELVHTGIVSDRVILSSRPEYRYQHYSYGLLYGLLLGLSSAMAICAVGMAFAFGRKRFAAVAVLSLCGGFAMAVTSGIAGMYMFTDSAQWNDESKISVLLMLAATLPWSMAIVLDYTRRRQVLWWVSNVWLALVLAAVSIGWLIDLHTMRMSVLITVWVLSGCLTLVIAGTSVLSDDPRSKWILATTAAGMLSFLMFILSYSGIGHIATMLAVGAAGMVLTLLGMLFIMYLQYRQGRSVLDVTRPAAGRDPLTGLRNASGFEDSLARSSLRTVNDSSALAFFWIQLAPSDAMRSHFGDEGFEHGLVRIASVLATCVDQKNDLARPMDNAFCSAVSMEFSPEQSSALATMMLSRILALSPEADAMTRYLRIAVAWMPIHGRNLAELQVRCQDLLLATNPEKKIVTLPVHLG